MTNEINHPEDRALWLGYRPLADEAPADIDANDQAAYLDGSAPETVRDRVERAAAGSAAFSDDLFDLHRLTREPVEAAPVGLADRLVTGMGFAPASIQLPLYLRFAAAAAIFVVCLFAYHMGHDRKIEPSRDAVLAEILFEPEAFSMSPFGGEMQR